MQDWEVEGASAPTGARGPVCQVAGCMTPALDGLKDFHQRYKICEFHFKAPSIVRDGELHRFCQQCGRFHPISAFDENKRSCRNRLARHNARRRRKTASAEAAAISAGQAYMTNSQGTGIVSAEHSRSQELHNAGGSEGPTWDLRVMDLDVPSAAWGGSAPPPATFATSSQQQQQQQQQQRTQSLSAVLAARLGHQRGGGGARHAHLPGTAGLPLGLFTGGEGAGAGVSGAAAGVLPSWQLQGMGHSHHPFDHAPHQHSSDPQRWLGPAGTWAQQAIQLPRCFASAEDPAFHASGGLADYNSAPLGDWAPPVGPQPAGFPRRPLSEPVRGSQQCDASRDLGGLASRLGSRSGAGGPLSYSVSVSGTVADNLQGSSQQQQQQQPPYTTDPFSFNPYAFGARPPGAGEPCYQLCGLDDASVLSASPYAVPGASLQSVSVLPLTASADAFRSELSVLPLTASAGAFRNEALRTAQHSSSDGPMPGKPATDRQQASSDAAPVLLAGGRTLDALWEGLSAGDEGGQGGRSSGGGRLGEPVIPAGGWANGGGDNGSGPGPEWACFELRGVDE